jgi:hypothetical protein
MKVGGESSGKELVAAMRGRNLAMPVCDMTVSADGMAVAIIKDLVITGAGNYDSGLNRKALAR